MFCVYYCLLLCFGAFCSNKIELFRLYPGSGYESNLRDTGVAVAYSHRRYSPPCWRRWVSSHGGRHDRNRKLLAQFPKITPVSDKMFKSVVLILWVETLLRVKWPCHRGRLRASENRDIYFIIHKNSKITVMN